MRYLIDTDWMIDRLVETPEAVSLLDTLSAEGMGISIVTYMELFEGTLRSPRAEGQPGLDALVRELPVLMVTMPVARRCATVRFTLRRDGKRVNSRALDLVIAATAIENGLTLFTRNVDDYADIAGLEIYGTS